MACSIPVVSSRADTWRMPSASTAKVTSTRAMPAGIGGMPFSVKRASERQSRGELALALHHVDVDAGLVVGVGGELLVRARRGWWSCAG